MVCSSITLLGIAIEVWQLIIAILGLLLLAFGIYIRLANKARRQYHWEYLMDRRKKILKTLVFLLLIGSVIFLFSQNRDMRGEMTEMSSDFAELKKSLDLRDSLFDVEQRINRELVLLNTTLQTDTAKLKELIKFKEKELQEVEEMKIKAEDNVTMLLKIITEKDGEIKKYRVQESEYIKENKSLKSQRDSAFKVINALVKDSTATKEELRSERSTSASLLGIVLDSKNIKGTFIDIRTYDRSFKGSTNYKDTTTLSSKCRQIRVYYQVGFKLTSQYFARIELSGKNYYHSELAVSRNLSVDSIYYTDFVIEKKNGELTRGFIYATLYLYYNETVISRDSVFLR